MPVSKCHFSILAVYVHHGPIVLVGSWFFNLPSPASKCANLELSGPPMIQIVYITSILCALICGIYYDISLSHFLKKKNNAVGPGGSRLIPWKSGGQEYSILVPVSKCHNYSNNCQYSKFVNGWHINRHGFGISSEDRNDLRKCFDFGGKHGHFGIDIKSCFEEQETKT